MKVYMTRAVDVASLSEAEHLATAREWANALERRAQGGNLIILTDDELTNGRVHIPFLVNYIAKLEADGMESDHGL